MGEVLFVTLDDSVGRSPSCDAELIALDQALEKLSALNPRQAQIVESRFFSGLSVLEVATLLNASESLVERDWRAAKAWLAVTIRATVEN